LTYELGVAITITLPRTNATPGHLVVQILPII